MKEPNNKMELLGNAPVPRALLTMGLPTMVGMMINALYNLVDAYFVGGLGTSHMGAISVAFPLGQVVVGLGLLFGNGGRLLHLQAFGPRGQGGRRTGRQHRALQQSAGRRRDDRLRRDLSAADSHTFRRYREHSSLRPDLRWHLRGLIHLQHL